MSLIETTAPWPFHDEDEIEAVKKVLASGHTNYWTGSSCRDFEKEFADFVGTKFAIGLMNATVALETALYALDIGPGDEVITSSRTFLASASCIVMRGATPIIADVDIHSQNITAETIERCITPRTKAIIVVHLSGWPADMPAILALADKYQLKVIEDCAQAHGASIDGRLVGSWGDVAAFSFCQDKIMTTGGEGGMITTNDEAIWQKIWSYKDHGKNYQKVYHQNHPPGFRWLCDHFGTNLRMTEMQAAIGRVQLKKLPEWLALRKANADFLTAQLSGSSLLRIPRPPSNLVHANYKYYVFIENKSLNKGWSRDRIMLEMNQLNIPCFVGSCSEIQKEDAFKTLPHYMISETPIAKLLGETSLMFLIHPTLNKNHLQHVADHLNQILKIAQMDFCVCQ